MPGIIFIDEEVNLLTRGIRNAGTEVVEAKATGAGSATLAMRYAAAYFTLSLVRALQGIIESAYVESESAFFRFFAQSLLLGLQGVSARRSIRILRLTISSCSSSSLPP